MIAGREEQVAVLTAALERLDRGHGGCVALTGEPGVGKTRLVSELRAHAERRGQLVFDTSLGSKRMAELRSLSQALDSLCNERRFARAAERYRRYGAIRSLLEGLARRGPIVLVFDDLHRANAAALDFVAHLLRRRIDGPLLLVLAYHRPLASRSLASGVASAAREGFLTSIELSPLGDREARGVLGDGLDPLTAEAILRDCRGNPFYLTELARGARSGRRELPAVVRDAIADELSSVSPRARTVLRAAAVVDGSFDPELVARVAGIDQAAALKALDELVERDLVRAEPVPGRLTVRHPVVRRAVYESAEVAWLDQAHARAADVLAGRGAPAPARADHVARGAHAGNGEALGVLSDAGRNAVSDDPAGAARWLAAALRVLPQEADAQQRLDLIVPLALSLGLTGRVDQGRAALAGALELLPQDPALAVAAARLDHMLGRPSDHRALLDGPLELAVDHWYAGEWGDVCGQRLGGAVPRADGRRAGAACARGRAGRALRASRGRRRARRRDRRRGERGG